MDMNKYKIVFEDGRIKCIFGYPDFEADDVTRIKVITDQGNILYINKSNIVFMKEIKEGF
jgi:hypothetical protein